MDTAEVDRAIAALKPPQHGITMQPSISGTAPSPSLTPAATPQQIRRGGAGHRPCRRPTVVFTGDLVEESADPDMSTPIPTPAARPATLDRHHLRSAALTPATSRGTVAVWFVASAPGCEHARAASLVKRQLLVVQGHERIRVGNADPHLRTVIDFLPHLRLFKDRSSRHQALT